ncbi:MAG: TolB family protein [Bacteroidia bacterium]
MRLLKCAIFTLCFFAFLCPFTANAQKSKGNKTAITKDNFRKMFVQANEMEGEANGMVGSLAVEGFVDSALHIFLGLYNVDTTNANIAYHVGLLYLETSTHKADALPYLEKAGRNITSKYIPDDPGEKSAPPPAYYSLARAQHLNYQFDNAILNFTKFKKLLPKKDDRQADIDYWIQCCNSAKILMQSPVDCKVINIGDSINSVYPDYCPVLTADEQELFFTSRRPAFGDSTKDIYGNYSEDIWISYAKSDGGGWTTAKNLGSPINTSYNDATVSISPDGQTLMLYSDRNSESGGGDIYVSYKKGNKWSYPQFIDSANTGVINSGGHVPSASLSPDGQTLYFASDRPGGLGGTDLYKVSIQDNGSWGNPTNLGPAINTRYDEDAPVMHPDDSTLFFSSKGHNTMGGFDVFVARLNKKGEFDTCKNMGYPINTPDDDIYFTLSGDGRRAYYTSIRPGGYGEKDIYEVLFNTPIPVEPVAVLVGYIKTPDGSPIPGDVLISTSNANGSIKTRVNPKTGKFLQVLRPNTNYKVTITSNNKSIDQQFYLPMDSSYTSLSRAFFRTSITLGDTTNVLAPHKKQPQPYAIKGAMEGIFLDEEKQPVNMLRIQLVNEKDSIIATTVTDKNGHFTFNKLASNDNYLLKVDVNDTKLKHVKHLYLADKDNRIVRDFDTQQKKDFYYKNLPIDLATLQSLVFAEPLAKKANEKYSRDTASMPKSDADFTRYFAYNINKVDMADADFTTLVDKIAAKAATGAVTITIKGSASKVPTHSLLFLSSNATLAQKRGSEALYAIKRALKEKHVDISKLTFKVNYTVQGPDYANDAADQVKYEKYQYVKVYI